MTAILYVIAATLYLIIGVYFSKYLTQKLVVDLVVDLNETETGLFFLLFALFWPTTLVMLGGVFAMYLIVLSTAAIGRWIYRNL